MLTNAQLKHLQSLKLKRDRQNYGEFIIEGDKLVTEALLENVEIKLICAEKQWISLHQHAIPSTVRVEEVTVKQLEKISSLSTPQSVIAMIAQPANANGLTAEKQKWTIVLDNIQDPGNLGTIIRSADWFGITTIICSKNCVDQYNPKAVQASMGSIFRVKMRYTDIEQFLKKTPIKKYAAMLDGKNISTMQFGKEGILVIGSESHGITDAVLQLCDEKITIGKTGKAESLNAAVATSILIYRIVAGN